MLKGKCVVIGVTGSIAAYKIASLVSMLKKQHCDVEVILTESASQFITPITFESLTGTKCMVDTFDRNFKFDVTHISLAQRADIFMVAPASANIIGKMANGIADDMLSTTILACKCPKVIAPTMNTGMYNNKIVQDNINKLKGYDFEIIEPASGRLACGDIGAGKMPEPEVLYEYIVKNICFEKDLKGKKVLVTAGATREAIDPVRFITNHSSGKMGCAIAKAAMLRGAEVTLVAAHTEVKPPMFVNTVNVVSAEEMFNEVADNFSQYDFIFKAAAVADYTPIETADEKVKKKEDDMAVQLKRTKDILKYLGENKKENQVLCGFSMETENMIENSKKKLDKKNLDFVVANNLKTEGAGFGTDTNVVTIISKNETIELYKMSKEEVAHKIIDYAVSLK